MCCSPETRKKILSFMQDKLSSVILEDFYYHNDEELSLEIDCDDWASGASKMVFFYDEFPDLVIKIPLHGDYHDDYYCYAQFAEHEWDYCESESAIYNFAVDAGLETFFAETEYVGTVGDIPIYCSARCSTRIGRYNFKDNNSEDKASALSDGTIGSWYLAVMIDQQGEEKVRNLLDFIDRYELDDFHPGNIGVNSEGTMVLIDYSGYND